MKNALESPIKKYVKKNLKQFSKCPQSWHGHRYPDILHAHVQKLAEYFGISVNKLKTMLLEEACYVYREELTSIDSQKCYNLLKHGKDTFFCQMCQKELDRDDLNGESVCPYCNSPLNGDWHD